MKKFSVLLAIAFLSFTGCANLGNAQKQAAPQPTVEQQKPTAEEQIKKIFEAGVYWGSVSLGELSMADEYKGKPVPMEIIVKTAWAKLADAQKVAAEQREKKQPTPAVKK